jgi:rSAM/selenodomain-associated transferase 2
MKLSVIVPMLDEAKTIAATLDAIRAGAPGAEIIVVDGGSNDGSPEVARSRCDSLIQSPRGRGRQMNAGASCAHGDALAFVHADTIVPPTFGDDIARALADEQIVAGRFDIALDVDSPFWRFLAWSINVRSRIMKSGTGDQAIFARRSTFTAVGCFSNLDLCEDVDLMRRLRRMGRMACLRQRVMTSARRWRNDGPIRTIFRMWLIKSLFLAGMPSSVLKRHYGDSR